MAEPEVAEAEAPERLTSGELLGSAGISERQMDHWVRQGYLHPEHEGGSGNGRNWPPAEAEVARRMGILVAAGITPAVAACVARDDREALRLLGAIVTATREQP